MTTTKAMLSKFLTVDADGKLHCPRCTDAIVSPGTNPGDAGQCSCGTVRTRVDAAGELTITFPLTSPIDSPGYHWSRT